MEKDFLKNLVGSLKQLGNGGILKKLSKKKTKNKHGGNIIKYLLPLSK